MTERIYTVELDPDTGQYTMTDDLGAVVLVTTLEEVVLQTARDLCCEGHAIQFEPHAFPCGFVRA